VRYIERPDSKYKGGTALSTITLLFNEADDLIFYKYMDYLESLFSNSGLRIIDLKNKKAKLDDISYEINKLHQNVSELLYDLQKKERSNLKSQAFPEEELQSEEDIKYNFKIVVCGDPGVGKTSTILRFTEDAFARTYIPTLGVNISEKNIRIDNFVVKLVLWDIAGQIKFETMRRYFYKGAEAVVLMFDLTNRISFESISNWYKDVKRNIVIAEDNLIGILLGNKEDLVDDRKINFEESLSLAAKLNLEYIEISALTGKNVEAIFFKLAETIVKSKESFLKGDKNGF
jgi:small GTP-binding protein